MIDTPNLPIKVGSRIYTVKPMSVSDVDLRGAMGQCDKSLGVIYVCFITDKYDDRMIANTLVHELMHAVYYEWSMQVADSEERIVTAMSNGFSAVMADNPEWFEWLAAVMCC